MLALIAYSTSVVVVEVHACQSTESLSLTIRDLFYLHFPLHKQQTPSGLSCVSCQYLVAANRIVIIGIVRLLHLVSP